jgi:ketosteroid isomerase-like protein
VGDRRIDLIRELVETWNKGDVDAVLDTLGPDFEFTPDPSFPDPGAYTGEQLRSWLHEWQSTWEGNRLEVLGITDHGTALTLESRWHLVPKGTADVVPVSDFTMVLWFDDQDRPLRMAAFFDQGRALEVAQTGTG